MTCFMIWHCLLTNRFVDACSNRIGGIQTCELTLAACGKGGTISLSEVYYFKYSIGLTVLLPCLIYMKIVES